jgi:uncharacterized phage protein gp47/JayE
MATTRTEIPSLDELRTKYLNDVRRLKIRAGVTRPNVSPGSESYIRGDAVATRALELHAEVARLQDAQMPDTAVEDDLDRLADVMRGIARSDGAGSTGYVKASVTGTVTYAAGQQLTAEDSLRFEVLVTTLASNNSLVPIRCLDVGVKTNKAADTELTWTSPPTGSATTCLVDPGGLTGGKDAEDDEALRVRLQNALRFPAESGSWADYAKWAEDSYAGIQKAFVYPAAEGPGTVHVALAIVPDPDTYYTREANDTIVNLAALAIVAESPEHVDVTVQSVVDESQNLALRITLPSHRVDGGPGGGWVDHIQYRWPSAGSTTPFATRLNAAPTSSKLLAIYTYSAPTAKSHIAIWSSSKKKFVHGYVKTSTLVSGTVYNVELYSGIDTSILQSGDYVSPDAEAIDDYGKLIVESFGSLGPGEKTSSSTYLPRSYRRPRTYLDWPSKYTSKDLSKLSTTHSEVSHVSLCSALGSPALPYSPTVPGAITTAPNVLVLGNLALYPSSGT